MASRKQRYFRPRSPIPKQRLIKDLTEGLTLEEIGLKYNKSRSFVSECCAMYKIDLDNIDGREEKKKERKRQKRKQSFIDVMYSKIEIEL